MVNKLNTHDLFASSNQLRSIKVNYLIKKKCNNLINHNLYNNHVSKDISYSGNQSLLNHNYNNYNSINSQNISLPKINKAKSINKLYSINAKKSSLSYNDINTNQKSILYKLYDNFIDLQKNYVMSTIKSEKEIITGEIGIKKNMRLIDSNLINNANKIAFSRSNIYKLYKRYQNIKQNYPFHSSNI